MALYNAVLGACVQSLDKGQGMDLIILGQKGSRYNTLGHIGGTVVSYKDTHQPLK